ncbi:MULTISPECIES: hypothetical protein [Acinetobacter]|uniref:hypothetical protein n=1 Tax=Acinetobacter TaxID=469 RepID=UPI001439AFE1|nr:MULTISPECIES: hypothetical protein [Acinetobacter]MDD0801233.1 hypothetical protein [Acinetobacter sp. Gutcm_16]NKG38871.1 hypothetical protein [Acinetobacter johnsonii]
MTYGYRINLEQILLKRADEAWSSIKNDFKMVPDSDPITGQSKNFLGPEFENEVVILTCVDCVLGWAITLESVVNLVWITNEKTQKIDERSIRGGTIEKFKELCRLNQIKTDNINFIKNLKTLINVRNGLVHYKKPITYVGFSFAPQYQHEFSFKNMNAYQTSVHSLIKFLDQHFGMDSSYINGEYKFFYMTE